LCIRAAFNRMIEDYRTSILNLCHSADAMEKTSDKILLVASPPIASWPRQRKESCLWKSPSANEQRPEKGLHDKLINLDPWNDAVRYDDDDTRDFLIEHPETCRVKYEFEGFSGRIYPISMLCALAASKDAVEIAYDAFPVGIKESDLWVGTPLHYATAYKSSPEVVEFLILSYKSSPEVVEFLILKNPTGVESTNCYCRTPLHMGALFKAPKAAQIKDKEGYTPLHLACENAAESSVVQQLVSTFTDAVYATSQYDMTPLHFACSQNTDLQVAKVLLVIGKHPLGLSSLRRLGASLV